MKKTKRISFKCTECGHEFIRRVGKILEKTTPCPKCKTRVLRSLAVNDDEKRAFILQRSYERRASKREFLPDGGYHLKTGWAEGDVEIRGGKIVAGIPIFKKMFGQPIAIRAWGRMGYRLTPIASPANEATEKGV